MLIPTCVATSYVCLICVVILVASSSDFYNTTELVRFSPGHSSVKVPIFIRSDNIIECTEAFQVTLHIPDKCLSQGIQLGHPSTTTIFIKNG